MFAKKEPLVELKLLRISSDVHRTGLPISQKFYRHYRKGKQVFKLEKDNSSLNGAEHAVYILSTTGKEGLRIIKVDGQEKWGEAFSWADAERAIMELLDASCIQRDHETAELGAVAVVSGK